MRRLALAVFLTGCSDDAPPDLDAILEKERIALGLRDDPLPLEKAMKRMERYERPLASATATLEDALRIENLLQRTPREARDGDFPALLDAARTRAREYARARLDGPAEDEAVALERACVNCHQEHR